MGAPALPRPSTRSARHTRWAGQVEGVAKSSGLAEFRISGWHVFLQVAAIQGFVASVHLLAMFDDVLARRVAQLPAPLSEIPPESYSSASLSSYSSSTVLMLKSDGFWKSDCPRRGGHPISA